MKKTWKSRIGILALCIGNLIAVTNHPAGVGQDSQYVTTLDVKDTRLPDRALQFVKLLEELGFNQFRPVGEDIFGV